MRGRKGANRRRRVAVNVLQQVTKSLITVSQEKGEVSELVNSRQHLLRSCYLAPEGPKICVDNWLI